MTVIKPPETPTAEKWAEVHPDWVTIYLFFEWLQYEKGYLLAEYLETPCWKCSGDGHILADDFMTHITCPVCDGKKKITRDNPSPVMKNLQNLFYEYAEVDPSELEKDRRALLDYMRRMNEEAKKE